MQTDFLHTTDTVRLAVCFSWGSSSSRQFLTSRHLLHEDLDEAVLADGAEVLDDVLVLQVLVEGDLLVEGLRVPESTRTQI